MAPDASRGLEAAVERCDAWPLVLPAEAGGERGPEGDVQEEVAGGRGPCDDEVPDALHDLAVLPLDVELGDGPLGVHERTRSRSVAPDRGDDRAVPPQAARAALCADAGMMEM